MRFAIVTTSFQPGSYILETIQSVIEQAGDFEIYYHVQDAGSTDGTVEYLQGMVQSLTDEYFPIQCQKLTFSYKSEADKGMYDGINRGFKHVLDDIDADVMLWINSDDKLAPNALLNIKRYFDNNPTKDWIIGRTVHLDEQGNITINLAPYKYEINNLKNGRHDGNDLPYVTQEATVWRRSLWDKVGKLDDSLDYAGDYEYWKRLASFNYQLESVDIEVGYHRKREGQLSSIGCYSDEVRLVKLRD